MNIPMDGPRSWSETMAPWSFLWIMNSHGLRSAAFIDHINVSGLANIAIVSTKIVDSNNANIIDSIG